MSNVAEGRVAYFYAPDKPFELASEAVRVLKPGEILVKIKYTTLCGSDIHTVCGRRQEPAKVVLGHEIVGDIVGIHPSHAGVDHRGAPIAPGDRIIWTIFSAPADAIAPRADIPQKSASLFKYGHILSEGDNIFSGGLADYCILQPNTTLINVSHSLPLKVAATISCAHATIAGALRMAGSVKDKKVLVFGTGMLGLSCIAMCQRAGASWIGAIDTNTERLEWAGQFGAASSFLFPAENGKAPWPDADIVFDMTGDTNAMKLGVDSLAIGGVAVWIGAVFPNKPVPVDAQQLVRKILQIRGLHNYNYDDFANATNFIEKHYKDFPFEKLVEKEFVLEKIDAAFDYAKTVKPVRVGITFDDINKN